MFQKVNVLVGIHPKDIFLLPCAVVLWCAEYLVSTNLAFITTVDEGQEQFFKKLMPNAINEHNISVLI
ncbi:MAG: hypothetical protein GYA34_15515 [Chloroflexi bacterium]|nr:hypothetical protein [Chloroflexota bacterium]